MNPLLNGLMTGMFLQLALGPVFFYIFGITIESGFLNAFFAILAVTLADYIYIVLSLLGISSLLQKTKIKTIFGYVSSMVLILFGLMIFSKGLLFLKNSGHSPFTVWTPLNSFTSSFILTISSPLTIVFWSSVFSAKAIEKGYRKNELIIFGMGTGASTFLFLSAAMIGLSALKSNIPGIVVQVLNAAVGLILLYYGAARILKMQHQTKENRSAL